ncbi:hypothetical protein [Sphingobium fuliginis]|nr:hypothetical protein [Sphingobium fuliginis]
MSHPAIFEKAGDMPIRRKGRREASREHSDALGIEILADQDEIV